MLLPVIGKFYYNSKGILLFLYWFKLALTLRGATSQAKQVPGLVVVKKECTKTKIDEPQLRVGGCSKY